MAWSIQIGRAFGIPIRLHVTFLLLIGWLAILGGSRGDQTLLSLTLGLFGCVLLHELGHAVTAQRLGVRVLDITLLPIGGIARMARMPREPRHELWIACAGPAVNFVLAALFYLAHGWLEPDGSAPSVLANPGFLLGKLAALNLTLGLFNLLPAFPMDGGRILRALLAQRMPYPKATRLAASLGQLFAFALGFLGLFALNPLLVFIAMFLFVGATEEGARAQAEQFVEGVPVRDAMIRQFTSLGRGDLLGRAVDVLLAGTQQDFPIVEAEEVVGILTRRRLLEALARFGRDRYVSEVMEPAPAPVWEDSPLADALERMVIEELSVMPVVNSDGLCGLLTNENTAEYLLVRAALLRSGQGSRP